MKKTTFVLMFFISFLAFAQGEAQWSFFTKSNKDTNIPTAEELDKVVSSSIQNIDISKYDKFIVILDKDQKAKYFLNSVTKKSFYKVFEKYGISHKKIVIEEKTIDEKTVTENIIDQQAQTSIKQIKESKTLTDQQKKEDIKDYKNNIWLTFKQNMKKNWAQKAPSKKEVVTGLMPFAAATLIYFGVFSDLGIPGLYDTLNSDNTATFIFTNVKFVAQCAFFNFLTRYYVNFLHEGRTAVKRLTGSALVGDLSIFVWSYCLGGVLQMIDRSLLYLNGSSAALNFADPKVMMNIFVGGIFMEAMLTILPLGLSRLIEKNAASNYIRSFSWNTCSIFLNSSLALMQLPQSNAYYVMLGLLVKNNLFYYIWGRTAKFRTVFKMDITQQTPPEEFIKSPLYDESLKASVLSGVASFNPTSVGCAAIKLNTLKLLGH